MTEDGIVTEPTVRLIARSDLDQSAVEDFLAGETWERTSEIGTELLSEFAGRVCYMSFGEKQGRKSTKRYLENIITSGHGSVLEHASWTFLISGVSRSFTHELVRHRAGVAFSQLSQRYVDEGDTRFVMPPLIREMCDDPASVISTTIWSMAVEEARRHYESLTDACERYLAKSYPDISERDRRKRAREAARSVLPNATETIIVFTANARALRHVIEYRGSEVAEAEIRRVAICLARIMQGEAPLLFGDYDISSEGVVSTDFVKV